jgi:hypothetical protein
MRKLNPDLVKNASLIKYSKDYRVEIGLEHESSIGLPPKRTKRSETDGRKALALNGCSSQVDK